MKLFADLYLALDRTTKTSRKTGALERYFKSAPPEDAAWALYFLSGRRLKRLMPASRLAQFAQESAALPEWLFFECIETTGDFAEAAALVLPTSSTSATLPLGRLVTERILPLRSLAEPEQRALIEQTWRELDDDGRFVFHKVLTGAFRVGVSELLVLRGLAAACGVDAATLKHRTMGEYTPSAEWFRAITSPVDTTVPSAADAQSRATSAPDRPYPFFLAHPLEGAPVSLGPRSEWQVEWKWDGIRCQAVRRGGVALWSRGEELVTDQFPEVVDAIAKLPAGTVIDGEAIGWRDGGVLAFSDLQRRLNRKKLTPALLSEVPMALMAYDLLEEGGLDLRAQPMSDRRARLERVVNDLADARVMTSPLVDESLDWDALATLRHESRARRVEGYMLKRKASGYGVGRKKGDWWKHKIDPYAVDAVLVYAQQGSGKRASLFTDYTFAVWRDDTRAELVTFAKAYSGLTDDEIKEVDGFVRKNTVEKFGPVRHVKPELVFEIGFEGIAESKRHKSGIAVRFPRMLKWRIDKKAPDADTLAALRALLAPTSG